MTRTQGILALRMEYLTEDKNQSKRQFNLQFNLIEEQDRIAAIQTAFKICTFYLSTPCMLIFWIADLISVPQHKWIFLILRCLSVPLNLVFFFETQKMKSLSALQKTGMLYFLAHGTLLTAFVYLSDEGAASSYYAGLNIAGLVAVSFFYWTRPYIILGLIFIFGPYYGMMFFIPPSSRQVGQVVLNSFFIFTTILIGLFLRAFLEQLRVQGLQRKVQLQDEIASRDIEIKRRTDESLNLQLAASIGKMSAQIAHDIRSPLAALNVFSRELSELPEEKRLILNGAIRRVGDISTALIEAHLSINKRPPAILDTTLLSGMVDSVLTEKRILYRQKIQLEIESNFNSESYGLFIKVNEIEFKRLLSNLIDNAVEALIDIKGQVRVDSRKQGDQVLLTVSDNGKGIPSSILPQLCIQGKSFGKENGLGLGLFHARNEVEKWGGTFNIESTVGQGTCISLLLPLDQAPAWFVDEIRLDGINRIFIVDDDSSIHQIWDHRFAQGDLSTHVLEVIHLTNLEELEAIALEKNELSDTLFLIDFELGNTKKSGLEMMVSLNLVKQSILVTSHFEDRTIRLECEKRGIKLLPKAMAGLVPISAS